MTEKNKGRYIAVIAAFCAVIFGLGAAQLLPDRELSYSERRRLAQVPEATAEAVFSSSFSGELEAYLLDQFPLRDGFRTAKAALRFGLFRQSDNNGIYLANGGVYKTEYPLKPEQAAYAAARMNFVRDRYFPDSRVFYSVIPDKSFYVALESGHPLMDYSELLGILSGTLTGMEYIDIFDTLDEADYYRTDPHWRQERLRNTLAALTEAMGTADLLPPWAEYASHSLSPFYGAYCGQSALPVPPDELVYLTNDITDGALVSSAELAGALPVYTTEKFSGMDGYDVFLAGAQAVVTLENPAAPVRELVIFRDSFGSSIAPLMLGAYSKITLVDLRYISSALLEEYIDFGSADVLFLYSAPLFNSGGLLK